MSRVLARIVFCVFGELAEIGVLQVFDFVADDRDFVTDIVFRLGGDFR